MSQMMRETRLALKCENEVCQHHGQVRYIRVPYLGNDVFFLPTVFCVCGWELSVTRERREGT